MESEGVCLWSRVVIIAVCFQLLIRSISREIASLISQASYHRKILLNTLPSAMTFESARLKANLCINVLSKLYALETVRASRQ